MYNLWFVVGEVSSEKELGVRCQRNTRIRKLHFTLLVSIITILHMVANSLDLIPIISGLCCLWNLHVSTCLCGFSPGDLVSFNDTMTCQWDKLVIRNRPWSCLKSNLGTDDFLVTRNCPTNRKRSGLSSHVQDVGQDFLLSVCAVCPKNHD